VFGYEANPGAEADRAGRGRHIGEPVEPLPQVAGGVGVAAE
jgi:hypothetical protein